MIPSYTQQSVIKTITHSCVWLHVWLTTNLHTKIMDLVQSTHTLNHSVGKEYEYGEKGEVVLV